MLTTTNVVSIHPYFDITPGQLEAAKALLQEFCEKTASEPACLYYHFTLNDHRLFCREAYEGAAGVLAHLDNVGALLDKMLTGGIATLARLELHGSQAELEKLKEPLAAFNPDWYVFQIGAK